MIYRPLVSPGAGPASVGVAKYRMSTRKITFPDRQVQKTGEEKPGSSDQPKSDLHGSLSTNPWGGVPWWVTTIFHTWMSHLDDVKCMQVGSIRSTTQWMMVGSQAFL